MTKYAALLRGIAPMNPQMRNEKLRAVAQSVGLANVASVISSGNLVFDTNRRPEEVEEAMEEAWPRLLGFESTTLLRSQADLEELEELAPFGNLEHGPESYLLVTFSKYSLPEGTARVDMSDPAVEVVGATDREIFTVTDTTVREGGLGVMSRLEAELGKTITSRTWLTVGRILRKMG